MARAVTFHDLNRISELHEEIKHIETLKAELKHGRSMPSALYRNTASSIDNELILLANIPAALQQEVKSGIVQALNEALDRRKQSLANFGVAVRGFTSKHEEDSEEDTFGL